MITASAPAATAFAILTEKSQVPRWMSAMSPVKPAICRLATRVGGTVRLPDRQRDHDVDLLHHTGERSRTRVAHGGDVCTVDVGEGKARRRARERRGRQLFEVVIGELLTGHVIPRRFHQPGHVIGRELISRELASRVPSLRSANSWNSAWWARTASR